MHSRIGLASSTGYGFLIMVLSSGSHLLAAEAVVAPEIDGGSISVGLGILTAGILILRARGRSN